MEAIIKPSLQWQQMQTHSRSLQRVQVNITKKTTKGIKMYPIKKFQLDILDVY